jgi:hypothetical protein
MASRLNDVRRAMVIATVALSLAVLGAVPAPAATPVAFGRAVVAIPFPGTNTGPLTPLPQSEPQILIAKDGRILVAAQFQMWNCETRQPLATTGLTNQATGTDEQRLCVWASSDGGQSFHIIGGDCCQNGDDVSLAQTPVSGTLLEAFMSNIGVGPGVPGLSVSRSTDNGLTWHDQLDSDAQVVQDRPFMTAESEGNVLISFTAPPGNIFVVRSADRGAAWTLPAPVMLLPPEAALSLNGPPSVDTARHEIVLSYANSSSGVASAAGAPGSLNVIGIARSRDHGATWTTETAASLPPGQGVLSLPSLSSDAHGHEYLVYDAPVGDHGVGAFLLKSTRDGSWSAPTRIDPAEGSAMEPAVQATGDGGLAVAYYHAGAEDARDHVRAWTTDVAVSRDGGATFAYGSASGHVVYMGDEANAQSTLFDLLGLAIDAQGRVNVVWTDDGTTYPNDLKTQIEFARQAEGTAPGTTLRPAAATKTTASSVRGATITLETPAGCVRPGSTFSAHLRWKREHRKGNAFVAVRRVDFYLGARHVKVDRAAPFAARLAMPRAARPGSIVTVRARALLKDRRGKTRTTSIRAAVRVCA